MDDNAKWYIRIGVIWGYITAPILFIEYFRELILNMLGFNMTYLLPFLPISWVINLGLLAFCSVDRWVGCGG